MEQEEYLTSLLRPSDPSVRELEEYAKENHIPIMEPLGIHFLMQLIRIQRPENILEIGSAIGYSALQMVNAFPATKVTTIERDPSRYEQAVSNIKKNKKESSIEVLFGDALELQQDIAQRGPYDLLFIDAAKGKYQQFFNSYAPLLQSHGVIITDNVLFKGYVYENEDASKRMKKLAQKIDSFNQWLHNLEEYQTVLVPVGDGIAITTRK